MGLHQLVYISQIATDESVLNSIHSHAVRNNTARTVTGMLLFCHGRFLQVLEGERKDVHHTFDRIKEDPRHDHVTPLLDKPIEARHFSHWNMGFKHLSESDVAQHPEFDHFLKQDLHLCQESPDLALTILDFYA